MHHHGLLLTAVLSSCLAPPAVCSFLITNTDYSFMGISTQKLALVVAILMSALGGILLTALLHGEVRAGWSYEQASPGLLQDAMQWRVCAVGKVGCGVLMAIILPSTHLCRSWRCWAPASSTGSCSPCSSTCSR